MRSLSTTIKLVLWLLVLSACTVKDVEERDRDLVLRIEQLQPYGLSLPPDFTSYESFKRRHWIDGSVSIEYEFMAPEELGLPYLSSTAERNSSNADACESYSAGNFGMGLGLGGDELSVRNDLFQFGDKSTFGLLMIDGNASGNYFGMCRRKIAFDVVLGGFYFDDGETWEELLKPILDALGSISSEQTEEIDGLIHEIGEKTPFSGIVWKNYPSGSKQSDENFINGRRDGFQTTWYENGQKKSEFSYVSGKRHGSVTTWHENGQMRSLGHFINDKQEGLQTVWYKNGRKKYEASNANEKLEGLMTTWEESGQKSMEAIYSNGTPEGLTILYYENGQKRSETNKVNGKREGLETVWYENGQKKFEGNHVNGKQEGLLTGWREDGSKLSEAIYVNGEQEGRVILWYDNGQRQSEVTNLNGKQEGVGTSWYRNGQKESEVNFVNGELDGLATMWHENGQKRFEGTYRKGKEFSGPIWWDESGNLVPSQSRPLPEVVR